MRLGHQREVELQNDTAFERLETGKQPYSEGEMFDIIYSTLKSNDMWSS